jgi:phosphohistidine phosphatase SixA
MVKKMWLKFLILAMGVIFNGCIPSSEGGKTDGENAPLVVFLVRHAEKVDHSRDPDLSEDGYRRADALALTLADAEIGYVHSSDYIRTRKTAAPVAGLFSLEVEIYDPSDLYTLSDELKAEGGRHLVVGHSNTTPALVEILGGDPGQAIEEEYEYDRLYILTIRKDTVSTVLLRYGKSYSSLPSSISASSLVVPQISASALKSSHTLGLPG